MASSPDTFAVTPGRPAFDIPFRCVRRQYVLEVVGLSTAKWGWSVDHGSLAATEHNREGSVSA